MTGMSSRLVGDIAPGETVSIETSVVADFSELVYVIRSYEDRSDLTMTLRSTAGRLRKQPWQPLRQLRYAGHLTLKPISPLLGVIPEQGGVVRSCQ